jgi:phage recombination protein Bet
MIEKNKSIERVPGTMEVWSDLALVRAQFAPTLTETEFKFFVTLGQSLGANPFKREIWSVKYDRNQPASIFLGRDMYRRKSQEQKEYDGHVPQAIYENDEFKVVNGIPEHSYGANDRGKLLGAYCMCWKKTTTHPYFVMVKIDEYNKNFANWKTMPETMIKKVAEAQCLRGAYQGVFAGTYDESEEAAIAAQYQPSAKGMIPPPPLKPKAEPKFEEAVTVTATEEPERTDDPGPTEPPMGNPATESEPPDDFKLEKTEPDDNSLDGFKSKIRKVAAQAFPNENSFALWLKTATASEDGKYKGFDTMNFVKSVPQAKVIYGKLQKYADDKKKKDA